MFIQETEEKLFENDTTMTLTLLAEAVRATLPVRAMVLLAMTSVFAVIWAIADRIIYSDGIGSPGRPGFRVAVLIAAGASLLFLFVVYPFLCGLSTLYRLRRAQGIRLPHHSFSFYSGEVEVTGANGVTVNYPYSAVERVKKTRHLLLLCLKNGGHVVLRLDSFHGCDPEDFLAFAAETFPGETGRGTSL